MKKNKQKLKYFIEILTLILLGQYLNKIKKFYFHNSVGQSDHKIIISYYSKLSFVSTF